MKDIAIADVRNFVIMGHTGSGKTAIVDAMLFKLGINDRHGSTDDGSSLADWTDEEKDRKITIWTKPFDGTYKNNHLVFIDTPGYADFYGQVVAASSVADAALLTVDASSGIQVGTNRSWRRCETIGLPRGIAVTGIDKDNTDFNSTLESIQAIWGATRCLPATIPNADNSAIIDIFAESGIPAEMAGLAESCRNRMIETAAETNDALLEKYLGGETLTPEEIRTGLRTAVNQGKLIPVFAVCARKELGLEQLMDGFIRFFPSPLERATKDVAGETVDPAAHAAFVGKVWRSVADPFVGQLTYVRVYGGTLNAESEIYNASSSNKERIGILYAIRGKKQDTVPSASAGDIVAIAKLKHTALNATLCATGTQRELPQIVFPNAVMAYAVTPKTQGDDDKLGVGLARICDEDPTLRLGRNDETHEMILSGMGDVQLDIAVSRLKARNHVEVNLNIPKVAYKETITAKGEGHYKHKKQSGGRGQYGDVYLRVFPRDPSDEEWFVNSIFGGSIPGNFIPAIEKGLHEGMAAGALAGYPVTNIKVEIYDGSYHDVDSSEIAFKIAGCRAFREGMKQAKPVLLEPIMHVKVMIPDQFMGDITGDLNHRRGRIHGFASEDGMQVITADVPQAEMFQYSSQIRSITGGQGSFEMEFSRYEPVPSNVAQKIIAEYEKNKVEND